MDITLIIALRVVLLALSIWGAFIPISKAVHRVDIHALNLIWPATTIALFTWSMRWLS